MIRSCLKAVAVAALVCAPTACRAPEEPVDAAAILRAMHDRYHGIRPGSLTFVQQTVIHREGVPSDTTTWYEAAVPGRLRIDFTPLESGNAAIYDQGTLHRIRDGHVILTRPEVNPLLLLLMDVYQVETHGVIEALDTLGFDLSIVRDAEWEGRPVWVVGAAEGDETSAQFWVEKDRLLTLRVIQPVGGGTSTFDARVTSHRDVQGYPQEDSILMYLDGALYQEEYYSEIRAGAAIDPALFDTTTIRPAPYWR